MDADKSSHDNDWRDNQCDGPIKPVKMGQMAENDHAVIAVEFFPPCSIFFF